MNTYSRAELTSETKKLARSLGARLVGIASVDRFRNAPFLHSPQALLPAAKSVVVVATIWTDASMELTEKEISEYWHNPADVCEGQGGMGARLDPLVFSLSKFLEREGWPTLPLPQTNYWRWRPYKTMKDAFAPPLAHRYAAVAAGLGDMGWCGAVLTPEYGNTQRFVAIITDAKLEEDPVYRGKLCRGCLKCTEACPVKAISKRDLIAVEIEDRVFEFGRRNRLRCEWANRFGLVGQEGPKYMGCKINVPPPPEITLKSFEEAMLKVKELAPVERLNWNLVFEKCLVNCPVKGTARHAFLAKDPS